MALEQLINWEKSLLLLSSHSSATSQHPQQQQQQQQPASYSSSGSSSHGYPLIHTYGLGEAYAALVGIHELICRPSTPELVRNAAFLKLTHLFRSTYALSDDILHSYHDMGVVVVVVVGTKWTFDGELYGYGNDKVRI